MEGYEGCIYRWDDIEMAGGYPRQRLNRIAPEDVDPAFGSWLAGLVDGEGCFIFHIMRSGTPKVALTIQLRNDDRAGLVEIRRTLGIGTVCINTRRGRHAMAVWQVQSLYDCLWMARFFEVYPLCLKKARDLGVWAAALRAWVNHAGQNDLRQYATRIRSVRQYKDESVPAVPAVVPDATQERLLP